VEKPKGYRAAPLIAVTGRRRPGNRTRKGPPGLDMLDADVYFSGYADQVGAAGGIAVHLPSRADPEAAMDKMDALVLSGGADVDTAQYGAVAGSASPAPDPERDTFELSLLAAALERGRPVLAICRGLQLVNVSRGGTLHGHLAEHPVGPWHEVLTAPGSIVGELYGAATMANSLHHQGVDQLGRDLVATARAADDVIEAIELSGADLLAVQWHPEHMDSPQPVFSWLVEAARARVHAAIR
jgi:putative glutamine amidotransferase